MASSRASYSRRLELPFRDTVDRQRTNDRRINANRDPDERYRYTIRGAENLPVGSAEGRLGGYILDHKRPACRYDLVDCFLRHARPVTFVSAFAPAGANCKFWNAVIVEQRDEAVSHLHKRLQKTENVGQGDFEPAGSI
ncbi:hypothetical protein ABIG04_009218 [Bradyrhizobium japonicum]